jgi:hypothetical protein
MASLLDSEHLEIQTAHRVLIERSFYAAELVASPKCLSTVRAHQVTSPIISMQHYYHYSDQF